MIGGSILRALAEKAPSVHRRAWARRDAAVREIREIPNLATFASTELEAVIEEADLVILGMPTGFMADTVRRFPTWPAGEAPLITDVGSVKEPVHRELTPLAGERNARFLGSHPMAGSEKTGLGHSDAGLFEDASVILTPDEKTGEGDLSALSEFWSALGGRVSLLSPRVHDETVAAISHLPHLVASALTRAILGENRSLSGFCGGGFRDTTRVAAGPAEMWTGILLDNHETISEQLARLIGELGDWKEALDSLDRGRLRRFLSESQELRDSI